MFCLLYGQAYSDMFFDSQSPMFRFSPPCIIIFANAKRCLVVTTIF